MPPDDVHCVRVRFAFVDDDGQAERLSQLKLLLESDDLPRPRHVLIVIIQSDFPDGADLRVGAQAAVDVQQPAVHAGGIVRVAAHGGIDEGIFMRQLHTVFGGGQIAAHVHDRPLLCQRGEDLPAVGVKAPVVQMGVRVKIHPQTSLSLR